MATLISTTGKTPGYTIQWYENHRRKTLYLGGRRYSRKTATNLCELIETLVFYRYNGITIPDKGITGRLQALPNHLQEKLAKAGLIAVTKPQTIGEIWETFLKHKTDVKPLTRASYRFAGGLFFQTYSPTDTADALTPERLLEWKANLHRHYAAATITGILKTVKTVFNWAVRQELLPKNPMRCLRQVTFVNRDNDRVISLPEYELLLAACPCTEWRVIVSFARIGGLRCPSELRQLRWADIDWNRNRFRVKSPKTEHHEGHRERVIPLFPELRTELDRYFNEQGRAGDFIISRKGSLHSTFQNIAKRAGLGTIVRPFDNMRMSRSNEILNQFGQAKESLWIGHSAKIMREHYLCLTDEDYAAAVES